MEVYHDIERCFSNQKRYFDDCLRMATIKERRAKLERMKSWIVSHKQDIRDAIHADFQKPEVEIDLTDIKTVLWELDQAIKSLGKWANAKRVGTTLTLFSTRAYVQPEPLGVVLIIAPWNFPFNLSIGPLVSAVSAGNCAILKPSELTPHTSALIERMVSELFPEEEVCVIQGDVSISQQLLTFPFDHVFFTGSTQVGQYVLKAAAEHYTSVTLELGGMNPAFLDKDVNLPDVVKKILYNKTMNAGQSCLAINCLYVLESERESIIQTFRDMHRILFPSESEMASIINEKHVDRLAALVEDARSRGAVLVFGGTIDREKRKIPFTLLRNVAPDSRILQEEIFGPVLPIVAVNSIDEAIQIVLKKPKPLATYIFTKHKSFSSQILGRISSGTAVVNDTTLQFMHPYLPFGGVNHSGMSRAHGYHGFLTFSNQKSVLKQVHGFSTFKLVFPPYTPWVKKIAKLIFDWF